MLAGLLMLSVGQSLVTNDYRSQLLAASSDHIRSSMSDHWSEVANKHMPQSTREDFHALAMDTLTEPLIKRLESVVGDYSQGFLQKRAVGIVSETNPLHMDVVGQAVPNLLDAIKDVVRSWGRVYAGIVRALKAGIPVKEWRHIK